MYDHSPPVAWPSCSWTSTCSSDRPALAADLDRERAAVQPRLDRGAAGSGRPSRADAPAGALELDLERLEDVAHERAGARLELELRGREGQVHPRSLRHADQRSPVTSRATGRAPTSRAASHPGRRARVVTIRSSGLAVSRVNPENHRGSLSPASVWRFWIIARS